MFGVSRWTLFAGVLLVGLSSSLLAQQTAEEKAEPAETAAPSVDPKLAAQLANPQATLRTFLQAVNAKDEKLAASCLDLSGILAPDSGLGWEYSVRLKNVIDRMWRVDYDLVPDDPELGGYTLADSTGEDLIGEDAGDASKIELTQGEDGLWRFSPETLASIDDLWERWRSRDPVVGGDRVADETLSMWIERQFPPPLHEQRFLLRDYQWICLLVVIALGFVADLLVRQTLYLLTKVWFRYIHTDADHAAERKIWKPVGLLSQGIVWYVGSTAIGLPPLMRTILVFGLKLFSVVAAVWTAFLMVDLLASYLGRKAAKSQTKFDDLLVPLISKSLKVVAFCVGVLLCAEWFNLPMTGLLGGLGIGGMALALASKDAVSNLFGSMTVLVDRPFEVGDWVITNGVEGTVEAVGFRSTRVRTFYNSQITVPNSLLTTAVVDNMGRRRYRRIKAMLGLQYDTTPEQMEAFCEGIRELLRRHPYTRKDYYHVYFNEYGDNSLNVLLYCFVECPDWSIELREKHRLFLDIFKLAAELGVQFAFPTRTLHMYQEQASENDMPADFSDPSYAGQLRAAQIAGKLPSRQDRPGGVQFTDPTPVDE